MRTVPSPRTVVWLSNDVLAWMRQKLADAGCDPSKIPDEPARFMRSKEVLSRTGIGSSVTLWRRMKEGNFPASLPLREAEKRVAL